MLRFCLGVMSLGIALFLGGQAYWCHELRDIFRACGGSGNTSEVFGLVLPYPIAISLLVALSLIFAFGAIFALLFPAEPTSDSHEAGDTT
jgi:hypothetical protein